MSISHHPDDATLMGFAAGTLSEPFAILVASHLELCGKCRSACRTMADLGAAVMEAAPPQELAMDAAQRLFAALDESPVNEAEARARSRPLPPMPVNPGGLPQALARVLGSGLDAIRWHQLIPGVDDLILKYPGQNGVHMLRFLRAAPGKTLPEHSHAGTELTLVLHGALRDGEAVYGPGDVTDMDDEGTHNPAVHGAETCICVFANEAPSRFKQLKFRVLQKLIGI